MPDHGRAVILIDRICHRLSHLRCQLRGTSSEIVCQMGHG